MISDPIADMLTRLRNAALAGLDRTKMPMSKLKRNLAEILKQEGYISDYSVDEAHPPTLTVFLRYTDRQSAFNSIRRTSRPGRRVYVGHALGCGACRFARNFICDVARPLGSRGDLRAADARADVRNAAAGDVRDRANGFQQD